MFNFASTRYFNITRSDISSGQLSCIAYSSN